MDNYLPFNTVRLKSTDKLLPKLDLKPGDDFDTRGDYTRVEGLNINGVYLQKI